MNQKCKCGHRMIDHKFGAEHCIYVTSGKCDCVMYEPVEEEYYGTDV